MDMVALIMLGALYSGSSMMKKRFSVFVARDLFDEQGAHKDQEDSPQKYINVLTHEASAKNTPAKRAITGILAPQGIHVVSIAVALLSLSSLIVRQAMIPGIPQPVLMIIGIMDFPERPTLLKIGSMTTLTRAI